MTAGLNWEHIAVENGAAMGYNGSAIDPAEPLTGGLPERDAKSAYGGSPLSGGNMREQNAGQASEPCLCLDRLSAYFGI